MFSPTRPLVVVGCMTAHTPLGSRLRGQRADSNGPAFEAATPSSKAPARGRTTRKLAALKPVADSVCREHSPGEPRSLHRCEFVGPLPGEIASSQSDSQRYALLDALLACRSDTACMGVSTDGHTSAPWYTVSKAKAFTPNDNSYGCRRVIRCS